MRLIEQKLKEFNEKKLQLEIIKMRIETYEYALNHPEIRYNEFPRHNPFSVKDSSNKGISIVEINTLSEEKMRELLKEEISKENSRAKHIELDIKPFQAVINRLSEEENYIIECKIFTNEKFSWRDIEINYNAKFKNKSNYKFAAERTLQATYYKSLDNISNSLGYIETDKKKTS